MKRTINRGSVRKETSKAVLVYFPKEVIPFLDMGVKACDLDRSKFIRAAVREKLSRLKVSGGQP